MMVKLSAKIGVEDLTALSSKEYLISIKEAREDYKHGRVKSIEEIDV
jgi:hypothetical protein